MPDYRRLYVPGATGFFTLTLQDRRSALLTTHIDLLRSAFRYAMTRHPFVIDALVVLPEHLHLLMTLPDGDRDYSTRIRLIKRWFTTHLPGSQASPWQKRFWEHVIRNDDDFRAHLDYVHFNPVKHGYVEIADQWLYSSIHRYVAQGKLPAGWGSAVPDLTVGER
ncbi:MAG: transposase [Burkholderiaceae bacterium]|nr:transposase [Burkholderiaceae bacterium]